MSSEILGVCYYQRKPSSITSAGWGCLPEIEWVHMLIAQIRMKVHERDVNLKRRLAVLADGRRTKETLSLAHHVVLDHCF